MRKSLTFLSAAVMVIILVTASVISAAPMGSTTLPAAAPAPVAASPQPEPAAPADPAAAPAAAPDKLPAGQGAGAYYLDYGSTVLDPNVYPVRGALRFFGWSGLQSGPGAYNWAQLDAWIAQRWAAGLSTGVFISTYDGKLDGDIRSTPDFVIQTPGAMIVMPDTYTGLYGGTQNGHVDYYKYQNGNFESSWHELTWQKSGDADVVNVSSLGRSWAGKLGGVNNSAGALTKVDMRIPAMPPEAAGMVNLEMRFDRYVQTTDATPNADHLYVELLDASGNVLDSNLAHITNSSGTNNTWVATTPIDISPWVGRALVVRFRSTTDAGTPTTFYVDNVEMRVRLIIPRYWSTAYKDAYRTFVTALGTHLKNDQRVDFVSIGTGLHGETQPANDEEKGYLRDNASVGLTSSLWVQTANEITDMYVSAFTFYPGSIKNLVLQYAPYYLNAYERKDMTDHAAGKSVGLSYNGLLPDWSTVYTNGGYGSYDPMIVNGRYNFLPIAWETYTYMLCSPTFTYWALFNALDKHADYMRIGDDLLTGAQGVENTKFFTWAKNFWGKTQQTTPSVWVVMREHRNPTPYCHASNYPTYIDENTPYSTWPQLGNYSFWLVQDDTIAGGKTVAETNDPGADSRYARNPVGGGAWPAAGLGNCPTTNGYASFYPPNYPCNHEPYNADLPPLEGSNPSNYYAPHSWTGNGKEAWIVRRTDQDHGNPYMWFRIDPQYIDGSQVYSATVTVKYFDMGTDTWSLRYDSTTGEKVAGTVTKTGTKQLKEVTFNIGDAKFAKRLANNSADFAIDSNNDGNEWIHMVDLAKKSSFDPPTPTPTATSTPTQTPTPTVTPTATPTTGIVEGYAFWDKNGNGNKDPDDPGVPGAVIVLKQSGVEMYSATSDADGKYRFAAVSPGQYFLSEKTPPPGYLANPLTVLVPVQANQTFDQVHFGHTPAPTSTPTLTPTRTATPTITPSPTPVIRSIYLPLVLRDFLSP